MYVMAKSVADVIELGILFSDLMADGPIIQNSLEFAFAKGVTLKSVPEDVKRFRKHNQITLLILMSYTNPIEGIGINLFSANARISGVDGVLRIDAC